MTTSPLANALLACAAGIYTHEAGVGLLIANRAFLDREDFTSQFITTATDGTMTAAIDWQAAVTALDQGQLPCSSGERHMLKLAASIAAGTPVSLSDALTGIDRRNASLVINAVTHATGHACPYPNGT
jgi:hypothetical protein